MAGMKNDAVSRLEDHLGYWLRGLSNLVSRAFADRLEGHGVSVPQWVALRCLYDMSGATLRELAAAVEVDEGALSRLVERLHQKGFLTRQADPTNRRAVRIDLTDAGRALVPVLAREADENDRAFFDAVDEEERRRFLETVKTLLARNGYRGKPLN